MRLKSVQLLESKKIPYRLIELSQKGISFDDVVKYSKDRINPEEICKTIIVKDKKGNYYAFLLKGKDKINFSKAREIIGEKISIVSYDDLLKKTGTEPGAVCPFLLDFPLFVDKKVFESKKINFGSGDHLYGLEITSADLSKIISFTIWEVAEK